MKNISTPKMEGALESTHSSALPLVFKEGSLISSDERIKRNGHNALTLWFTGLSGAGKSTLSRKLERKLWDMGLQVYVLDGDNLRHGLNKDLGFSPESRHENIRRAAELAAIMNKAGFIVLAAFISPYALDRETAASVIGPAFKEVYVDADVSVCRKRDPKGLYARYDAGEIRGLTGVDAPYEFPQLPDIQIYSSEESPEESVNRLTAFVMALLKAD